MAPSTPPPPPLPEITSVVTTNTARYPFQNPPRPPNPHPLHSTTPSRLPSNPNPNYPQLAPRTPHLHPHDLSQHPYPVASSGRGFISRPVSMPAGRPSQKSTIGFPYLDQGLVRPNTLASMLVATGHGSSGNTSCPGVMPGIVKGIPFPTSTQSKAGPPPAFISDINGRNELRDKNKDDAYAIIRDRKVRLSDDASLYSLCRSWLRNGFSVDIQQPQYLDTGTCLPQPLPRPVDMQEGKKGDNENEEETQDKDLCEDLTEKEVLQRHIKRAKRIRSRLNEERFKRIERYKSRLALLLSPPNDRPNMGNESASTATNKLKDENCVTTCSSDAENMEHPEL